MLIERFRFSNMELVNLYLSIVTTILVSYFSRCQIILGEVPLLLKSPVMLRTKNLYTLGLNRLLDMKTPLMSYKAQRKIALTRFSKEKFLRLRW